MITPRSEVVGDKTYILEPSNDIPFGVQIRVVSVYNPRGWPTSLRYWIQEERVKGGRKYIVKSLDFVNWGGFEGFPIVETLVEGGEFVGSDTPLLTQKTLRLNKRNAKKRLVQLPERNYNLLLRQARTFEADKEFKPL